MNNVWRRRTDFFHSQPSSPQPNYSQKNQSFSTSTLTTPWVFRDPVSLVVWGGITVIPWKRSKRTQGSRIVGAVLTSMAWGTTHLRGPWGTPNWPKELEPQDRTWPFSAKYKYLNQEGRALCFSIFKPHSLFLEESNHWALGCFTQPARSTT